MIMLIDLPQCVAFWPTDKKTNPKMVVMTEDSTEPSLPFLFTDPHTTVLKLASQVIQPLHSFSLIPCVLVSYSGRKVTSFVDITEMK